jgi:hypothetical protein
VACSINGEGRRGMHVGYWASYMNMVTISSVMKIFNLVQIPKADGEQIYGHEYKGMLSLCFLAK